MLKIGLFPDLDNCIEMVAKREYAAVLKQLLSQKQRNKKLEEKLEILRLFLETVDFAKLRAESERQLMEGKAVRFVVCLENGMPKYEIEIIATKLAVVKLHARLGKVLPYQNIKEVGNK